MKMRGCEDEKMFYRPPLLEEPCAQTLSGMKIENEDKMKIKIQGKIRCKFNEVSE